jgi:hypothetical protein
VCRLCFAPGNKRCMQLYNYWSSVNKCIQQVFVCVVNVDNLILEKQGGNV